jgi:hypothetical protein
VQPKDLVFLADNSFPVGSQFESVLCAYDVTFEYNTRVGRQAHQLPVLPEQEFQAVQSKIQSRVTCREYVTGFKLGKRLAVIAT